jgi:hypothetical protein
LTTYHWLEGSGALFFLVGSFISFRCFFFLLGWVGLGFLFAHGGLMVLCLVLSVSRSIDPRIFYDIVEFDRREVSQLNRAFRAFWTQQFSGMEHRSSIFGGEKATPFFCTTFWRDLND